LILTGHNLVVFSSGYGWQLHYFRDDFPRQLLYL